MGDRRWRIGLALWLAACAPPPPPNICEPLVVDAGLPRPCDAPVTLDPSTLGALEALRIATSALVCDWSRRCTGFWLLGQSYCHPAFASLEARRNGLDPGSPYDGVAWQMCIEALVDAATCDEAFSIASACRALSFAVLGNACASSSDCIASAICRDGACALPLEREPCMGLCAPGLICREGRCARPAPVGSLCTSDASCGPWLRCTVGRCRAASEGESCLAASCALGTNCRDGVCRTEVGPGACCQSVPCEVGACGAEGRCRPVGRAGCPCETDDECPWDVSRCVRGTCVLRPMPGAPCLEDDVPCFGSICDAGRCRPMRYGEGPCGLDADCEPGLVCTGSCGRLLRVGERCVGEGVFGRCDPDAFCDGERCAARAALGESCTTRPCVDGTRCDYTMRCVAR